jgi:regulator of sigma E protease
MSVLWQALWFLVAIALLVTIHEFGHYWVAKKLGFKVLRFSVGFGKPLLRGVSRGPDATEFVIAAIPLGGYVKLLDEREGDVPPAELHRSFTRKPPWQRILVLLAGPAANIVFAIAVLWAVFWANGITHLRPVLGDITVNSIAAQSGFATGDEILSVNGAPVRDQRDALLGFLDVVSSTGKAAVEVRTADGQIRQRNLAVTDAAQRRAMTEPGRLLSGLGVEWVRPPIPAVLGEVSADSAAAKAGLAVGDKILAIDAQRIGDFVEIRNVIAKRPGEEVVIQYERDGSTRTVRLTIGSTTDNGVTRGVLGVGPVRTGKLPKSMYRQVALGPIESLVYGAQEAWSMTVLQAQFFARMLSGQVSVKNLSGPLSIAEYAGDSATQGPSSFLMFLVLISLSLGFLNLLPIPILDGGQIIYAGAEWIKGSPLSERIQALGQQVGLALLVLLMGMAFFNDISRTLLGG